MIDTTKPSWEDAPEWANWLALDCDGNWWWFENEPWFQGAPYNEWTSTGKAEVAKHFELAESLESRPQVFINDLNMGFKDIDHEITEENKSVFDLVATALDCSKEHGIDANVFYYALMFLKTNPTTSISDAIEFGLDEWLK